MKFSVRIFFVIMAVSVLCSAAGGYILINSSFRSQLSAENETAREYGEIVFYSLAAPLRENAGNMDEEELKAFVSQTARSVSIDVMNQKIKFAVLAGNAATLFSSLEVSLDKDAVALLSENQACRTLKRSGEAIYIQTIRPARLSGSLFYIETLRDVTGVFKARRDGFETLIKIMAGITLFAAAAAFVLSKLLMRPIEALARTTRVIAKGALSSRAKVTGNDEITVLSEDFNKMADSLEEKIEELKAEADRKELFVGAFSHELKTPLTSIIGYADFLRRKELDEKTERLCAEYIFSEGKRLERLSMRLLELIVLRRRELSTKNLSMRRMLGGVIKTVMPKLRENGIALCAKIDEAVLPMEAELMKTVFINLIDNAAKATERGGRIEITGKSGAEYRLTVADFGRGMSKDELEKITTPFYSSDGRGGRGAGLGLAITSEIVRLHGFKLEFESEEGRGTRASVLMGGGNVEEYD